MDFPPSNDPGVSGGGQPTSEPTQAAGDAKPAAKPFGASEASGSGTAQDMVPRGLLDRLTQKMEGQKAELEQLRAQMAQPKREGYGDEISKLQAEAAKLALDDPMRAMELMGQASDLRAKAAVNDTLEAFMSQQSQQIKQEQDQQATAASWEQALRDYPELQDQNSDLYKSAFEIWSSDPYRDSDPTSMYKATVMANERRMRSGKSQPPALEGGNAPTDVTEAGRMDVKELLAKAKQDMRSGQGLQPLADLLNASGDAYLTKPKGWNSGE